MATRKHPKLPCTKCAANAVTLSGAMLYYHDNAIAEFNRLHDLENALNRNGVKHCSFCFEDVRYATRNLVNKREWSLSFRTKLAVTNLTKIGYVESC